MPSEEPCVGFSEVAVHLQVSKDTVYRWVDTQGLPAHRVGRLFRFRLSQVDKWVQSRTYDASESRPTDKTVRNNRDSG